MPISRNRTSSTVRPGVVPWTIAAASLILAAQSFRCTVATAGSVGVFAATLAGLAMIGAGVVWRRPATARAWLYIAAGRGALAASVIGGTLAPIAGLVGYACSVYGLVLIARQVTRVWDSTRWIDSTVVAMAAGVAATASTVASDATAGGAWSGRWLDPALPALDLLLVLLATRSLLAVRPRSTSLRLVTAGLLLQFAGDAATRWGSAPEPTVVWTTAIATLVIAAAAVHPSVARTPQQVLPWRRLGWVRFTVLVLSLATPLLTLVALDASGDAPASTVVYLAAATALIGLLVLVRVSSMVAYADDLADERHRSRFEALADHSHDATVIVGTAGTITWASPAVQTVLGPSPATVIGRPLDALVGASTARGLDQPLSQLATLAPGTSMELHATITDDDGRDRSVEGTATNLLDDPAVEGLVLVLRDITERTEMQRQLIEQALVDPLTGLANRALFADRIDHALAQPRVGALHQLAVLFIDLDDFKAVNDSLGHGCGDDLLVAVGRRIADAIGPGDTAARFGGDEFAVLIERVDAAQARATAEQVLGLLAVPLTVGDLPISVTASIGIAHTEDGSPTAVDLLRNADLAMYEAKREGKNQVCLFRSEMHERELRRFTFRSEVGAALEREQLHLLYQPIVDMDTEQVTGAEALIRWEHPDHGLVNPLDFIPVAEATGAIVPIGRWVLRTACEQLARWTEDIGPLTMDVNVSAVQLLDPAFVDDVAAILADTGVDAGRVVLELTESILVHDADDARRILEALRRLGVRLAIDDFGTGYSSLAYLQNFPIDIVKIDRAFVNQLGQAVRGRSLAHSIIAIAGSLGIDTIAEGIETPAQAADLTALECLHGQGYHYSRPIPAPAFTDLVADRAAAPAGTPSPPRQLLASGPCP
ncbi:MAG: domain S-box-containing protein/diguanylate cyclase (GGDEF)-like protein [Ilumatobacteraceae bacterium]|nr:domain S-box-containing protein/diguanylate cyclase (GGDEF)-like protein [Ilumatobacteraceae bacterium]